MALIKCSSCGGRGTVKVLPPNKKQPGKASSSGEDSRANQGRSIKKETQFPKYKTKGKK